MDKVVVVVVPGMVADSLQVGPVAAVVVGRDTVVEEQLQQSLCWLAQEKVQDKLEGGGDCTYYQV